MTTISSAENLKYMSGAESTTGTGVSTSTTGAVGTIINSAWTVASKEATREDKIKAGTESVLELLKLFRNNEARKAESEINQNLKKVEETQEKIESSLQKTYSAVQEKIDAVKALAEQVQKNIEQVEEANKEKEEYQKELEANLEKLDEAQTIINNPESTKEENLRALAMITKSRENIQGLAGKISELAKNNEELVAETEEISSNQEELSAAQVDLMDEAQGVLDVGEQEVQQQTAANTATATTAAGNEVISAAADAAAGGLEAASKASTAIPVVGAFTATAGEATAMKLENVSDDYLKAASTRFTGFANVGQELANTMGLITENYFQYANFSNAIGSISTNFESLSANFYSVNDALGSWLNNATTIETQAEEIARVEETVAEQIENENPENESQKVEINTEELKKIVA